MKKDYRIFYLETINKWPSLLPLSSSSTLEHAERVIIELIKENPTTEYYIIPRYIRS